MIRLANESEMELMYERAKKYFKAEGVVKRSMHGLRRGGKSPHYSDFDSAVNDPHRCEVIANIYADKIQKITRERKIDLLSPIEKDKSGTTGVIRLVGVISILTGLPNVPVRLGKELRFERLKIPRDEGKPWKGRLNQPNVVILTDHCTGGDEVLKAVDAIEYNGGIVTDVIACTYVPDEFNWDAFEKRGIIPHFEYPLPKELEVGDSLKSQKKR